MERERGEEGEPTYMESGEVVVVAQAKDVNDNLGHGIASGFGGGGEQRRQLPPSKNMKSQCIICKKYIVKQNMKDHAKVVHKTSEAKVLGHKSVLEMFAQKSQVPRPGAGGGDVAGGKTGDSDSVGDLNFVEDNFENVSAQEEQDKTDDDILPARKVRIICKDASGQAVDASCWTQEEKENLMNQIQSINMKMAEMQMSMASKVVEEVAGRD